MMRALSIRQPFAWLIVRPDITDPAERARAYVDGRIKDIENRGWYTRVRGRVLIHASASYSRTNHECHAEVVLDEYEIILPRYEQMHRGGIVGVVEIHDCVEKHPSHWKDPGSWGFVLRGAEPLPFRPMRGMLGIFGVPDRVLQFEKALISELTDRGNP